MIGRSHWTQWARGRPVWTPAEFGSSLVCWINASRSTLTLGGTPFASGTSPPAMTYAGTLNAFPAVIPYAQIDSVAGGTARGQATFKVSYDDGATFPHTGILTGATIALPGIGAAITANFPVGTYGTTQIWRATVAGATDLSGNSNAGVQVTAAKQPIVQAVGFNGRSCFDAGSLTATVGLVTPSMTLGVFSAFTVLTSTGNGYAACHKDDSGVDGSFVSLPLALRIAVCRSSVLSIKDVGAWGNDGSQKTILQSYGGSHASHLAYVQGALATTSNAASGEPGSGTIAGVFNLACRQGAVSAIRGTWREQVVLNRAATAVEARLLHNWARYDSGLTG